MKIDKKGIINNIEITINSDKKENNEIIPAVEELKYKEIEIEDLAKEFLKKNRRN